MRWQAHRLRGGKGLSMKHYYGLYRGIVTHNLDPMGLGRIVATVPDAGGLAASSWALPSAPVAGPGMGVFCLPPVGANVWIQFEAGDSARPVWTGGFWTDAAEVPTLAVTAGARPGGTLALKSPDGATIVISDAGIFLENGKGASLSLVGPAVSVNGGALEVT